LLRNVEQMTKRKISIESVPTIHDLRTRRIELTRASLEEVLMAGELDSYRSVVESLAEEYDVLDVAAAAVKMADQASDGGESDDEEIPNAAVPRRDERPRREDRGRRNERPRHDERPARHERSAAGDRSERGERGERPDRGARADRGEAGERNDHDERPPRHDKAPREERAGGRRGGAVTRVFVGLGRKAGVRPADLVGAIANEAGIDSRDIGAIDIADRFSLVEVPDESAEEVIRALRGTTIRGKRVLARRDRE
jgi:ATP-dependent RNA helicase DeaD